MIVDLIQDVPRYDIQAYLAFTGKVSYNLIHVSVPGQFPQLRISTLNSAMAASASSGNDLQDNDDETFLIIPSNKILNYIKTYLNDLDSDISPKQRSLSFSLTFLIHKLNFLVKMMRYYDEENYNFYFFGPNGAANVYPFPLNILYPVANKLYYQFLRIPFDEYITDYELYSTDIFDGSSSASAAAHSLPTSSSASSSSGYYDFNNSSQSFKSLECIYSFIKKAYASLDLNLHHNKWLLGTEHPTTIDALLFGHLMDVSLNPMRDILWSFPNLEHFRKRIFEDYFSKRSINHLSSSNHHPSMIASEIGTPYYVKMNQHTYGGIIGFFQNIILSLSNPTSTLTNAVSETTGPSSADGGSTGEKENGKITVWEHVIKEVLISSHRAPPPTPSVYARQSIHNRINKLAYEKSEKSDKKSKIGHDDSMFQEGSRNAIIFGIASVIIYAFVAGVLVFDDDSSSGMEEAAAIGDIVDLYGSQQNVNQSSARV